MSRELEHSSGIGRRRFLKAGGVAAASGAALAAAVPEAKAQGAVAAHGTQAPVLAQSFDAEADIVVLGSGAAGLPTALFSRWLGNEVILLEKADVLGGTANKAAFWYWIPNNRPMQEAGQADPKDDFIRYVARISQPQSYNPEDPRFGLSAWEYAMCEAIYESASPATELLAEKGALPYRHVGAVPDYWAELPEDKAPTGRVLLPRDASPSMSDGGRVAIGTLSAAAERDGVDIRTGHRARRTIVNASGEVVGVEAETAAGATVRVRARKAVIFATGGFTHNPDLRKQFLHVPVYGGCAAMTNEGDFIYQATALGAELGNMNYAWNCPVSFEKAINRDPTLSGMFSVAGDSMIFVDKTGRRVVNEKLAYNELCQIFFRWDGAKAEYPYLVLMSIWDQRAQDHSASVEYGRLIVPPGTDDAHVIKGDTIEALATAIKERLARYAAHTGGLQLTDDFADTLRATIERFNGFAAAGKDLDFHRGERQVEVLFNGTVKEEPGRTNPTMWPISGDGPYYAALVTGGNLDTKGGPRTNTVGQVLDTAGQPIPGLYGVGNCVASASGRAYWAGGATIGPILAFAHRAAEAASKEPVKAV